jgi:alpha/beta superfamily hydrolase
MNPKTSRRSVPGPAGAIEVVLDFPADAAGSPRGLALVAHPHPLFGGTMENKVVQTLARTFVQLGYVTARFNFRGVGATAGVHDEGMGETDDVLALLAYLKSEFALSELVLAGFSFGSFVQSRVAAQLAKDGNPAFRLVLVGTAVSRWQVAPVPPETLVIHGELDETVPLAAVLDWARPQELPVVVIPGADHFFHRRLTIIKRLVLGAWLGTRSPADGQA